QHPLHRTGRGAAQHLPRAVGTAEGRAAVVHHQTGDQTDQVKTDQKRRSIRSPAEISLTAMNITIHYAFLPHTDADAALGFYRDTLGFEVRNDVGYNGMRWITVGPVGQPGTSIVLHPPAAEPGITDEERRTILELIAKGSYGAVTL